MHVGIYLTMDIVFILSTYELILLGLPIAWYIDRSAKEPMTHAGA